MNQKPMPLSLSLSLLLLLSLGYKTSLVAATTSPLLSSMHPAPSTPLHRISSTPSTGSAFLSSHSSKSLFWVSQILGELRGGGGRQYEDDEDEPYDDYDEYDSEEEEDSEEDTRMPRGDRNRKSGYDHSIIDPSRPRPRPPAQSGYSPNIPQRGRNGRKKSSSLSSAGNAASAATKLATKSLSMTGSLAWNALVKQPGKLAVAVIRPKHVDLVETFGLWRLDQQVIEKSNRSGGDQRTITSVATIELARPPPPPRGSRGRPRSGPPPMIIVRRSKATKQDGSEEDGEDDDIVYRAPYTFMCKNKYLKGASLSSYQTSFVAPAFLVGENQTRLYGYKGTWQRKLADKSVIKLKGKIYQVHKQKFGKKRGEYVYGPAVGTFVMRRRISMSKEEEDDEFYDDESDDDDFDYDEDDEEYSEVEDGKYD
mmetsp:Transcript_15911/g.36689  ORF Transcript_15911/g.36689 Transcript_15911/m.36689 type:complete len:424 (-) Transcript_15911:83-1354(-)